MEAPAVPNLTAPRPTPPGRRDLATLPKAHLHLQFTGAMRPTTMVEMARTQGVRLPPHLLHIDAARRASVRASNGCFMRDAATITPISTPVSREAARASSMMISSAGVMPPT